MIGLNRRQTVLTLVMVAGLAGSAAVACPPEDGSTPPPGQQIEREIIVRGMPRQTLTARSIVPHIAGVTLAEPVERDVVVAVRDGSTLETRVYQPGEAMKVYGMKVADEPVRTLRVKEDGRDIRVEQRGQKVTATINGKEVPADAVTVKDGTIEVRDADGKTVLKEEWPEISTNTRVVRGQALAVSPVAPVPPVPPVPPGVTWPGNEDETPRVMMGITMDDADGELVEQLGLPEGDYAVIQTVPEGLPASKAGLQPKDLIVTVDGKSAAGSDAIREVMKTKQPGDTIALEVIRKGNRVKVDVKLEQFDSKRFRAYGQAMSPAVNEDVWKAYGDQMKVWGEKYGKEMEEKAKAMGGEFKNHVDIEALKDHLKLAIPRGSNGEPMIFVNPGEGGQKLEDRLNAMEAQLQRLEALLKRLETRTATPAPAGGGGGTPTPWFAIGV